MVDFLLKPECGQAILGARARLGDPHFWVFGRRAGVVDSPIKVPSVGRQFWGLAVTRMRTQ